MPNKRNRILRGFTLIELLIVIAIIAILALIAIPNFLEAQTRSKIARAQADVRSLATAHEAYFVDYNSYIQSAHDRTAPAAPAGARPAAEDRFQPYSRLTTPVAYLTSIMRDPFSMPDTAIKGLQYYNLYSGNIVESYTAPMTCYALVCRGPDRLIDVDDMLNEDLGTIDINYVNVDKTWVLVYDPTNGTISTGDIVRAAGEADFIKYFLRGARNY